MSTTTKLSVSDLENLGCETFLRNRNGLVRLMPHPSKRASDEGKPYAIVVDDTEPCPETERNDR